jgi:hypothetical protein
MFVLGGNSEGFISSICDKSGARSLHLFSRYARLVPGPVPKEDNAGFAACGGLFGRAGGLCLVLSLFASREFGLSSVVSACGTKVVDPGDSFPGVCAPDVSDVGGAICCNDWRATAFDGGGVSAGTNKAWMVESTDGGLGALSDATPASGSCASIVSELASRDDSA